MCQNAAGPGSISPVDPEFLSVLTSNLLHKPIVFHLRPFSQSTPQLSHWARLGRVFHASQSLFCFFTYAL